MVEQSESRIQFHCVQWYTNTYCLTHHTPRCLIFTVPNQNQHHLLGLGVLGGVSDLIVIHTTQERIRAGLSAVCLFVEVKTPTGRLSAAQVEFEGRVKALGYTYCVARSLDDFQVLIRAI